MCSETAWFARCGCAACAGAIRASRARSFGTTAARLGARRGALLHHRRALLSKRRGLLGGGFTCFAQFWACAGTRFGARALGAPRAAGTQAPTTAVVRTIDQVGVQRRVERLVGDDLLVRQNYISIDFASSGASAPRLSPRRLAPRGFAAPRGFRAGGCILRDVFARRIIRSSRRRAR